ncbi:uncharacterized protein [Spinacia oleracea]|uniref:ATP-dependent DNA helicase n=1 Tax=Spinacia oleracea TaxID=3562 RepID=A0ABM3QXE0_SPIOL|nr:uncharacterized protein LOC110784880 [Spinacia oleracea]
MKELLLLPTEFFFLVGATGGHATGEKHISARQYYAYKLQSRPNNLLLRAGRCFQQYIVDMYAKVENTRLDFFRKNQYTIREDLYQGILDTVERGENSAANAGHRVVLPPTFIGGPRDLKKGYLNAMALVQRYGKPDLLVTMTCNPNWQEIKQELAIGEEAQNRPDLVSRIFRAKFLALKKLIMEKHVFGEVAAMIYLVEFQKRGFPHAHFLIILTPPCKIKTPADYDKFVSVEVPSVDTPRLRKIILKHMMHDPCGQLNPKCPCIKQKGNKEHCKSGYPKQFCDDTTTSTDGFPVYRRRDTGETVPIRKATLDNRWVIPYNPYLSSLFDCHLNVEVHLPNMQTVQLRPREQLDSVIATDKRSRTSLTEFFKENAATPNGTCYLYGRFIEKYRCDVAGKQWLLRKNKAVVIGRLAFTAPSEGERYFLRLLLVHVHNPKSFEDLLTVDGYRCATFQEAALKRRLLEEDEAVDLCLAEACEVQMHIALRSLFATVLIFCQPSNPNALWDKYYAALSEDFKRQFPDLYSKVKHLTVRSVEQCLEEMGKSLNTFGLEHLNVAQDAEVARTKDITDALDAPIPEHCISCRGRLKLAQQEAFNSIIDHVKQEKGGAFFIDGPGGTGKTFLYNALYAEVRLMGKIVFATSTSCIAAANIPSGRTAHSRFKIPIDTEASLACDVPKQVSLGALIQAPSLIIWDEASMVLLVLPRKTQREAVAVSLVSSILWPRLIKFHLTENIRAREDPAFSEFLLALGNGQLQTVENSLVCLPSEVVKPLEEGKDPITDLTTLTFPELDLHTFTSDIFTTREILTPMNTDVDSINTDLIQKFPGQSFPYKRLDTMLDDNCDVYSTEFINTLCPSGMSPHEPVLMKGSLVILIRNILPASGLCNGTRLYVALSRARQSAQVTVISAGTPQQRTGNQGDIQQLCDKLVVAGRINKRPKLT